MAPYEFERQARTQTTAFVLAAVWLAIGLAIILLDASIVLMAVLTLFTAPALYDLIANRRSGLRLDEAGLYWFSGRRTGEIGWPNIAHIRLDTRLDFSVRASAVLHTGRKVRLPLESIPKADVLETALRDRDIPVERHHFSLLG